MWGMSDVGRSISLDRHERSLATTGACRPVDRPRHRPADGASMSEGVKPTTAISGGPRSESAERARREARTEAAVVVGIDIALIAGLAVVDKAQGWEIVDLPWWAWLVLVTPALLLLILLLAVPFAELSPGRVRNLGVTL